MTHLAVLATAALALASCADYGFTEQDLLLRHEAEEDRLEVLFVYAGVFLSDEKKLDESASRVAQDAEGFRHFIVLGWPWEFNLPQLQESLAEEIAESDDELAQRALAWIVGITVEESGLFRRDCGELCLYQEVSIPKVSEGLALFNDLVNREIAETTMADLREGLDLPDAATAELWMVKARAGKPWIAFDQGALVLQVPVSPLGAARGLQVLLKTASEDESGMFQRLFEPLAEFSIANNLATLRYGPGTEGWIHFAFQNAKKEYSKDLEHELTARGVTIQEEPPSARLKELVR